MSSAVELFSDAVDKPSIVIPEAPDGTKVLIISDTQVPFEDKKLLDAVFNRFVPRWLKGAPESHLFINGDGADNYTLSKFLSRGDISFSFKDELKLTKRYLKEWGKRFSNKHYVFGNHDARYEKFIRENVGPLEGIIPSYEELLGLAEMGYDSVPYRRFYNFLGFIITHGSRVIDNDAKAMLLAYHHSGTSGHTNRPKSWTYANAAGDDPITWYVTGMMCDTSIKDVIDDFKDAVGWQQGFLIGEVQDNVLFVENVRVHHGKFLAGGRVYEV